MIKNIVFDIGGVMLDISNEVLGEFLNLSLEETKSMCKMVYGDSRWNNCMIGIASQEEYMKQLIEEHPEKAHTIALMLERKYQVNVLPPIQEAIDYIKYLKCRKFKLYILSNITNDTYDYFKNKLGILDLFDGGVYSCKDQMMKPNREIYELLIERYNLNINETVFIDDTLKNVEAAKKVGIDAIQYRDKNDIINYLAKKETENFI